jgi:hypothetical protein
MHAPTPHPHPIFLSTVIGVHGELFLVPVCLHKLCVISGPFACVISGRFAYVNELFTIQLRAFLYVHAVKKHRGLIIIMCTYACPCSHCLLASYHLLELMLSGLDVSLTPYSISVRQCALNIGTSCNQFAWEGEKSTQVFMHTCSMLLVYCMV